MNFRFCYFRNILGQDLTERHAPAWILLDLKQRIELKWQVWCKSLFTCTVPMIDGCSQCSRWRCSEGSVFTQKLRASFFFFFFPACIFLRLKRRLRGCDSPGRMETIGASPRAYSKVSFHSFSGSHLSLQHRSVSPRVCSNKHTRT